MSRWTFVDGVSGHTTVMEVNPFSQKITHVDRGMTVDRSLKGNRLVWQGSTKPATIEVEGVVRSQEHLIALQQLRLLIRRQVLLTDHLGREWWVVIMDITGLQHVPRRRAHYRHTYRLTAVEVDHP